MAGRFISTLLLTLATALTVVMSVVPHHHHGDAVCLDIQHCRHDNTASACAGSECDAHNHSGEHHGAGDPCVATIDYFISENSGGDIKCKTVHLHQDDCCTHTAILPLTILSALLQDIELVSGPSDHSYGRYTVFYSSPYVGSSLSLRGPPVA